MTFTRKSIPIGYKAGSFVLWSRGWAHNNINYATCAVVFLGRSLSSGVSATWLILMSWARAAYDWRCGSTGSVASLHVGVGATLGNKVSVASKVSLLNFSSVFSRCDIFEKENPKRSADVHITDLVSATGIVKLFTTWNSSKGDVNGLENAFI